jgi:heavy metal sensor kinase
MRLTTMFTRSIRWRFLAWLAFLLVCLLSGFGVSSYQLQRLTRLNQIDEELERRVAALGADVRRPPLGPPPDRLPGRLDGGGDDEGIDLRPPPAGPFPERHRDGSPRGPRGPEWRPPRGFLEPWLETREIHLSPTTQGLFDDADTNGFYYVVWSRGGNVLRRATNIGDDTPRPPRSPGDTTVQVRMRGSLREAYVFTGLGECVLVGRSIVTDLQAMRRFAWWLVGAGGGVLLLGVGGGWIVAGRALRPIAAISDAASRISAGNLSERINVAATDGELGRLAGVLNSTFARLEAAFGQQKQFTADASHELRTPLAVLISEAQTALARPRTATEYRETIEACLTTAQQMRRLTDALLALARLDAGQEHGRRCPLDLAEAARACVDRLSRLAAEHGVRFQCDLAPAPMCANPDLLAQVVTNLLTNAVYYNRPGGEVRVSTRLERGTARLIVADTGIGIAAQDLPHIFERFYRADKARSHAAGRNGLGLAICKAIVEADGGTIEVASEPGVGSTFTVRWPASVGEASEVTVRAASAANDQGTRTPERNPRPGG